MVVAGASHPVGLALCREMAQGGATVVAMDTSDGALVELARAYPEHIEPLAIQLGNPASARAFGAIWGREPLALLLNLVPLSVFGAASGTAPGAAQEFPDLTHDGVDHTPDRHAARMAMAVGTGVQLVRGLCGALHAGGGAVVTVLPAPMRRGAGGLPLRAGLMAQSAPDEAAQGRISGFDMIEDVGFLEAQAMEGAMLRLSEGMGAGLRAGGVSAASVILTDPERIAPEAVLGAVLYLAQARGASGSVLRLAPQVRAEHAPQVQAEHAQAGRTSTPQAGPDKAGAGQTGPEQSGPEQAQPEPCAAQPAADARRPQQTAAQETAQDRKSQDPLVDLKRRHF